MTPEEVDKMPAGEELDYQVALAMGQTDFNHLPFSWFEGATEDGNDGWDGNICPRCQHSSGKCVKSYSQSYQYIDKLLKWLVDEGDDLFIEWWRDGEWFVCDQDLYRRNNNLIKARSNKVEIGELPNLPLALCRFILKVKLSQS